MSASSSFCSGQTLKQGAAINMASKGKCNWLTCDRCQVTLSQKDSGAHENNCPPKKPSSHPYIKNGIFYTVFDVYKSTELPKHISLKEASNLVFMSEAAMQLCDIEIGGLVLISHKDNAIVKTAWPLSDKNFNIVLLTVQAIELEKLGGPLIVQKLKGTPIQVKEIFLETVGSNNVSVLSTELKILVKNYNHNRIFCVGNRISIPFYGKNLVYKIVNVSAQNEEKLSQKMASMSVSEEKPKNKFYISLYTTEYIVSQGIEEKEEIRKQKRYRIEDVGGYSDLIEDLKLALNIGLGKCGDMENSPVSKGILLFGPSGVGKTMISEAILLEIEANKVKINASNIYGKNFRESEVILNGMFKEAFDKAPSIILIENLDNFCSKKSSSSSENEKRILETLVMLIDSLHINNKNVIVLATTSKLDSIDPCLRRPGMIDEEFEMPVPTKQIRQEILYKIIEKVPHTLNEEDVDQISFETHGFVGADLHGLCLKAIRNAVKTKLRLKIDSDKVLINREDFNYALSVVSPSAMKEVLVDVPNVKWSDIGGQRELKLKLRQSVELPLKHPEAFIRLGILPPKGVLMFGPPGCSKTMIAKALATESKLNFINVKGPEIFSKWVGESEKTIRGLFRRARQVAPSIIFIDEIDAIGGERSASTSSGGNSVQERVLIQLLTELDGVTALGNVTIVAATNRPDRIDKALLRPGRFDRLIYVPLPDVETRQEIFNIKLKKMPVSQDVDLKDLVDLTEGYSGAEIQAICNEAGLRAFEEDPNAMQITKEHFRIALSEVVPVTDPELIKIYDKFIKKKLRD